MIKVLIADDHAIVRKGLRQIVKEQAAYMEVDEAVDGQEVLEKIRDEPWDVLVLDISMPKRSGLDILQEVKHSKPNLPVLILSVHPEEQYAIRVLKAGAAGYMNKDCALDELVRAIQKVVDGGKYVSPTLAEKLAFELSGQNGKSPHEVLSDREYSVLLMIGIGKSVSEIANELALSVKTVSTYRSRVLEKLALKSNAELIRYVIDNQLT
ncbi:MAG: response regulator transcription factor [Chloroflexi bacterium]|nr:response regulator transcription factor [Chloroflexota bacterium]